MRSRLNGPSDLKNALVIEKLSLPLILMVSLMMRPGRLLKPLKDY